MTSRGLDAGLGRLQHRSALVHWEKTGSLEKTFSRTLEKGNENMVSQKVSGILGGRVSCVVRY